MSLPEVISRYAGPADSPDRPVSVLPTAEVLAPRLPTATPWSDEAAGEPRVLVDLFPAGDTAAQIATLAPRVGARDVAVVLLASGADSLPVGPLVSGLTAEGLRVVQVETIRVKEARTVVVVTRDDSVPRRSYLIGSPIPEDGSAQARMANEWMLEQFQLRARVEGAQQRLSHLEAQVVSLTTERDTAQDSVVTSARALAALEATVAEQRSTIRRLEGAGLHGLGNRVRKASRILKDDPVRGTGRLARAAGRRLRSR